MNLIFKIHLHIFMGSYDLEVGWSVSFPTVESNLMRQWWIRWEDMHSTDLIQHYLARYRIQRTKP